MFIVHDDTGQDLMYWFERGRLLQASHSYEEVQKEQGLKREDWVHDILVRYLIKYKLPTIIDVRKYKFSNKEPEKQSIVEKIRSFFPDYPPLPEQAF